MRERCSSKGAAGGSVEIVGGGDKRMGREAAVDRRAWGRYGGIAPLAQCPSYSAISGPRKIVPRQHRDDQPGFVELRGVDLSRGEGRVRIARQTLDHPRRSSCIAGFGPRLAPHLGQNLAGANRFLLYVVAPHPSQNL